MPSVRSAAAFVAPSLLLAGAAAGQPRILIADRTSDVLWVARDRNGNGTIDADEVRVWFDATNVVGTPGLLTPASLAVRRGGLVMVGDSDVGRRAVNLFLDLNGDGDAQDTIESWQAANLFGASDVVFAAPQGAAFDARGRAYIANASNASGFDAIYRLVDLTGDGDFLDAGEVTEFVGAPAFGSSSGSSFNPAEIAFIGGTGYMRNSGAGFHGVYRFEDLDASGRADDTGEFAGFWDLSAGNLSGVLPLAGLALTVDHARPRAFYTLQIASGGVDQLVRLVDANNDGTAHQPGEAAVVYTNAATGFGAASILSLADGRVLLSDSVGERILMLTDTDADNAFTSDGEAVEILAGNEAIGNIRQIALLPCPGDWTLDMSTNSNDISAFLTDWLAAVASGAIHADANADGVVNSVDISAFLVGWLYTVHFGC